ncbi:hypothetical protein IAR55_001044 [Kwoniella newhampshirensis]|uniref:Heat shock factor-binding protein 1 n=1 Tax=Kwoniella newhampshirensis TaxID=1651941 RepID=A0AAW0Z5B6_9TREE
MPGTDSQSHSQPQTRSNGPSTTTNSSTSALVPSTSSTKRLSTFNHKPNASSPARTPGGPVGGVGAAKEVISPGELCGFVDTLLAQLETRFDEMMDEMSNRIDHLETAIQDLMHGDIESNTVSPSPTPVKR